MRIVTVVRSALPGLDRLLGGRGDGPSPVWVREVLDRHNVPDGFAFVVDDDGSMRGCRYLNGYLLAALRQEAYSLRSLHHNHLYPLVRLLRFVRDARAGRAAQVSGMGKDAWLARHGEPAVDLTDVTRQDLVGYRRARMACVQATSWQSEAGPISGFFAFAGEAGWIAVDPVPRWGRSRRNTFTGRAVAVRKVRFLTEPQLRLFLRAGLRGDHPAPRDWIPAYPERDYAFGLTLAATALRREECACLLDCEVPGPGDIPPGGVGEFTRYGKGGRPRTVYVALELADELDMYRRTDRERIVRAAQPRLRRLWREGALLVTDGITRGSGGRAWLKIGGRKVKPELLSNAGRVRAVRVLPDGTIEPLALFPGRYGLAPGLQQWNTVFGEAHRRVLLTGHPDIPPAHLVVTPHVMRHCFAVRMLSGLMRLGRERAANPYLLLANPVLTVQQLLGHASPDTTQQYLYAAERYNDELPAALREHVAAAIGPRECQ